jgi:spermidine/putrescine transport system permease protein
MAAIVMSIYSLSGSLRSRTALVTIAHFAPVVVFVILPIIVFLIHSFWYVENGQVIYELTLRNYAQIFQDGTSLPIFLKTMLIGVAVTVITLLIAYPCAFLIWAQSPPLKYTMLLLFVIPLFMSYIVKIYAIRGMLGRSGPLNDLLVGLGLLSQPTTALLFNMTSVLITLSLILLPFAILPAFISLERIPRELIEASTDLGANFWHTVRHVVLPMSLPGTLVGACFCFVLAIGDFVTPEMVGGTTGFTLGRLIYSQFGMAYNWPFGAALSVILLIVVIAIIGLSTRLTHSRTSNS